MQSISFENIRVDKLFRGGITSPEVSVLRLDLMHPIISGNKWFKLRYYIEEARLAQKEKILTFGGAWSNHILATAAAAKNSGLKSTGIIRGEEPEGYSSTLMNAADLGMELVFLNRSDYKQKIIPSFLNPEDYFLIPEAGMGALGVNGAATIADHLSKNSFTHICCATGTGTTMIGLIKGFPGCQVVGINSMKGNHEIDETILDLLPQIKSNWALFHDYHFGGYAKYDDTLIHFMNDLYQKESIPTDFVYTGKLFYGIHDLIEKNYFPPESKTLIIHSGGLQGNASLSKGTLIF